MMSKARYYLELMRPVQWYKNLLIFIPLIFSLNLFNSKLYPSLFLGFISLSLLSSANYAINDVKDAPSDALHPVKKKRPIPSGKVSEREALVLAVVLGSIAFTIGYVLNRYFFMILVVFFTSTQLYTFLLKKIPILDVMVVSFNFYLRTIAGAYIINVEISPWLTIGIFFIALFLALGKRKAEYIVAGTSSRRSLRAYNKKWFDQALSTIAATTIATYSMYCVEVPLGRRLVPTVPLLTLFLLSYMHAVEKGVGENPHEIASKDKLVLFSVSSFLSSIVVLLYFF